MSRRNAAALLLTRGQGLSIEVFLVERSPLLRFFGGYLALPGGTLAPADGGAVTSESAAMQRCALRELLRRPAYCNTSCQQIATRRSTFTTCARRCCNTT